MRTKPEFHQNLILSKPPYRDPILRASLIPYINVEKRQISSDAPPQTLTKKMNGIYIFGITYLWGEKRGEINLDMEFTSKILLRK